MTFKEFITTYFTDGTPRLTKSVFKSFNELIDKSVTLNINRSKNLFNKNILEWGQLNNTGVVISSSDWYTQRISVNPNTNIFVPAGSIIAQYDSNDTFIAGTYVSNPSTYITTNASCAFIRVSVYKTAYGSFQVEYGTAATSYTDYLVTLSNQDFTRNLPIDLTDKNLIEKLDEYGSEINVQDYKLLIDYFSKDVSVFGKVTQSVNLYDKSAVTNQIINSDGTFSSSTDWRLSSFIEVLPNKKIYVRTSSKFAQYDINKNYIPGTYSSNGAGYGVRTHPKCVYIRIATYYTAYDTQQVEYGTSFSSYVAYSRKNEATGRLKEFLSGGWYGAEWICIGDSVTAAANYQAKVANALGMNVTTKAKGGLGIIQLVDGDGAGFAALQSSDFVGKKLITFFAGLNDRGTAEGSITDMYPAQNTIYGRYNYAFDKIFTLANASGNTDYRVVAIAPHKVGKYGYIDADGDDEYPTSSGRTLQTQNACLEAVCKLRSIPLIDLYKLSGINEYSWTYLTANTLDPSSPYPLNHDNVHPNDAGHSRIANVLVNQLRSI